MTHRVQLVIVYDLDEVLVPAAVRQFHSEPVRSSASLVGNLTGIHNRELEQSRIPVS